MAPTRILTISQRWTRLQLSHGQGFPFLTPAGTEGKAQTQPRCEENKVKAEFNTAHEIHLAVNFLLVAGVRDSGCRLQSGTAEPWEVPCWEQAG